MFENESRVCSFSPDVLDRARVLAGKATTIFKLPVTCRSCLRALIEEGLKRDGDRTSSPTSRPRRSGPPDSKLGAQREKRRGGTQGPSIGNPAELSGPVRQERGK